MSIYVTINKYISKDIIRIKFVLDSPISPNPSAENPNATSILLKWSPPFLWPGYSIDYYSISVSNSTSGHIIHSQLRNSSFNDALLLLMIFAEDRNIQSCHTLEILLSATSNDMENLMMFPVNGGYIPSNVLLFKVLSLSLKVLRNKFSNI